MSGRPAIVESPEVFQEKADAYFEECRASGAPLTFTGLALALGFVSRQSIYDYEKRPEFSYTVKRSRLKIEKAYEERLSGNNVAGAIFALKNYGWADRQEISGPDGGPIKTETSDVRKRLTSRIAGLASRMGTNGSSPSTNGNGAGPS